MERSEDPSGLLAMASFIGFAATAIWAAQMLPGGMATAFTAWILVSFPIGVIVGHCALSED